MSSKLDISLDDMTFKKEDTRKSLVFTNNRLLSPQLNTISGSGLLFEEIKQSRETLGSTTNTKASKQMLASQDFAGRKLNTKSQVGVSLEFIK